MRKERTLATYCPHCKFSTIRVEKRRIITHTFVSKTNSYLANRVICGSCNLKFSQKASVIIGHNISKMESHLILKSLNTQLIKTAKMVCKSSESIVSLTINGRGFVDFINLLDSPIYDLVHRLKPSCFQNERIQGFPLFNEAMGVYRNSLLLLT
jgi:hypothetical protein